MVVSKIRLLSCYATALMLSGRLVLGIGRIELLPRLVAIDDICMVPLQSLILSHFRLDKVGDIPGYMAKSTCQFQCHLAMFGFVNPRILEK